MQRVDDTWFVKHKSKRLRVTTPYDLCDTCGFDIVSYEYMKEADISIKKAKLAADAEEDLSDTE